MFRGILSTLTNWIPIREIDQALFAEALSQAITCGFDVCDAIPVAADTSRSLRFRHALHEMAGYCRQGDSLTKSLARTAVRTSRTFRAALDVGESRGSLANELAAFARSKDERIVLRLAASVGRSSAVIRFCGALARLLVDHRLTTDMLADASRVAGGKGSRFEFVIALVIEDMKDGKSLAESMKRQTDTFDPFLCALVVASPGRDVLRRTLARACGTMGIDTFSKV